MTHTSDTANQPGAEVLVITDQSGRTLRVAYQAKTPGRDGFHGIGFRSVKAGATDKRDGAVVRVAGQDLTALRDVILSMPDEAFPPIPPPPYESPNGWVDGDIVKYRDSLTVYVREDGVWVSNWTQDAGAAPSSDRAIDEMLSHKSHEALRQGGRFL